MGYRLFGEADLPLEAVILLIGGMTMLISGALLFPVAAGALPYYEDGLVGLLLVVFALQAIMLGKTPFGDMGRSKPLLAAGTTIAAAGIVTCFVPGIFGRIPRILLFLCFGPGGLLLLLRMCFAKGYLGTWITYGGIFRHLIFGCAAVYLMSMLMGPLILKPGLPATRLMPAALLAYGWAIIYLALVLRKIYCAYPGAEHRIEGSVGLSTDEAMLLLMGVFMLLLGLLLIPVNLGLLPFSGSAQLGLLMVIFSVQMLATGSTPIGPFRRSWLMILAGLLFAALGIVSCIIPGILVPRLTVLVGVLNILGAVIALRKICIPRLTRRERPRGPVSPIMTKLLAVQITMNLLAILFGASMLVSRLIPGLIIGVILAANGCALLYLLHILTIVDRTQRTAAAEECLHS